MISTRDPDLLPDPTRLATLCQALALLDEIMDTSGEGWFFAYRSSWWRDWDFGHMNDHEGNEYCILFTPAGVLIRGYHLDLCPVRYDHTEEEARALESRLFAGLPAILEEARQRLAGISDLATFGIWREAGDPHWRVGRVLEGQVEDPDGSEEMLWMLDDDPGTYVEWVRDHWGRHVDRSLIESVYRHGIITEDLILNLNPKADVEGVMTSAEAMGFPTSRKKAGDDVPPGGTSDPKE